MKYVLDHSDFSEDCLPAGQPPIPTKNLRRFKAFMGLINDSRQRYPAMGVVTGLAGMGKTVSVEAYLDGSEPRAHTGLPGYIKVKVKPRSTPKALAVDIVNSLRDKPRGHNIYEVADEAAAAILRNDLETLIVDEADRLNEDSFELLRHIFDKTGCPIVVVGLPRILSVIDRHEKFASRVGLRMDFRPPEKDEMLGTVLPGLIFSRWQFDAQNEVDLAMGERICTMVGPSLRKLRNLLQVASCIAETLEQSCITLAIINEAFNWSATKEDRHRLSQHGEPDESSLEDQRGVFERESERRRDGQAHKKRKSQ